LFDIYNELFNLFTLSSDPQHFLLRDIFKFMQEKHPLKVQDFITQYPYKKIHDHDEPFRSLLLSTNLSLFGNITRSGESSFDYFLLNQSMQSPDYLFSQFFEFGQFDKKLQYKEKIINLYKAYDLENTANMLQIFIPAEQINQFVYLSAPFGKPYPTKLTDSFDSQLERHMDMISILKKYRNEPFTFTEAIIDKLQARLYLIPEFFNPENNIKVFKFTRSSPKNLAEYKQKLRQLVRQMVIEWLETPENKTYFQKLGTPLGKLMEYLKTSPAEYQFQKSIIDLSGSLLFFNLNN
jgi:hypothetical protein